jgi:hypothetical protein
MSPMPDNPALEPNVAAQLKVLTEGAAMPLNRSLEFKIVSLLSALLMSVLAPGIASATLGEPELTVQTDVAQLHASIKSSVELSSYKVHEIQLPTGTVLREFVGADGKVFAVAWSGSSKPDLRQALGKYFDVMVSAPRTKFQDRKHMQIQQGDLVVEGRGHMRAMSGRAYLTSAVPSGVNLGDLH